MDNPYEEQQQAVITRILGTVEKLNETMAQLNQSIKETNYYNGNTAEIVELWATYLQNVRFNLASANSLEPPV